MTSDKSKESESLPQLAGLSIGPAIPEHERPPQPPRPVQAVDLEEDDIEDDENDPFADRNAVPTPSVEKAEPRWQVAHPYRSSCLLTRYSGELSRTSKKILYKRAVANII